MRSDRSYRMPYNFAAESFHTIKLCSRLSSRKAQLLYGKQFFSLLRPPLGVRTTYTVHLRPIRKLVGDFLLVAIELFSLGAFVLSHFTHLTDGQTDGQLLITIPRLHSCSVVKIINIALSYGAESKIRHLESSMRGLRV